MTEDDLIERAEALPDRYAERIPADAVDRLRRYERAGEYGELVSELTATLATKGIPVTSAEKDELRALVDATGEGGQWLDQLTVT